MAKTYLSDERILELIAKRQEDSKRLDVDLLMLEVLIGIRALLREGVHCPDCCYVTHGGQPSGERLRLGR